MSTARFDSIGPSAGGTTTDVMAGLAKAWVNFDQITTPGINYSFNVSSWTDDGVGRATFTLTNAMAAANQPCSASAYSNSAGALNYSSAAIMETASAVKFEREASTGAAADTDNISVTALGDLA